MKSLTENLIIQGHKYSSQYKNGLSNHLPMALYALDDIGASDEKISSFCETYVKKLEPIKPKTEEVIVKDESSYFSKPELFLNFVEFYKKQIGEYGLRNVLNKHLPILFDGVSGGAFHPLIRLAFALEIKNIDEITYSLASWAIAYQRLGGEEASSLELDLIESLTTLKKKKSFDGFKPEGYGVFRRMETISKHEGFKGFLNSFKIDENSLPEMADICIKLYLSSNDNFTALHAVTSCHALRIVTNELDNKTDIFRYYWHALGSAYVDIGMPDPIENFETANLPSWESIQRKACESSNDHLIKLVYTCKEEFKYYQNPFYQLAASKKVRIIEQGADI